MFTAKVISNIQNNLGNLDVTVEYSNGNVTFQEHYPLEANATTLVNTISSRIKQSQAAEDFVTSNPPGTQIQAKSTPIIITADVTITPV